jgi:hypothetical protein
VKITRQQLEDAAAAGKLQAEQIAPLWDWLNDTPSVRAQFSAIHLLWYAGALVVMGAMGWLMTEAWSQAGAGALLFVALVYVAGFTAGGHHLWQSPATRIPGGLLLAVAVSMTPLWVFAAEDLLGWWPQDYPGSYDDYYRYVRGGWLLMELATLLVGALYVWRWRFPFITMPIAIATWFLSMDLTPLLFGIEQWSWDERKFVSLWFGLVLLVVTFFIDRRTREDFAFWLYLAGLAAFWGGLSMMNSDSELSKLGYCAINVLLLALSVLLQRRAFAVFGAFGVAGYLAHLANKVFADSLLFPFALTLLGLSLIGLGIWWQRNAARVEAAVNRAVPASLRELLPPNRAN